MGRIKKLQGALETVSKAVKKQERSGLGKRAAEIQISGGPKSARDEAILAARDASKSGFLEQSAVKSPVYHATDKDFEKFSPHLLGEKRNAGTDKLGFWFGDSPESTEFYIHDPSGQADFVEGANIMPAYLQLKNPYFMSADEFYELSKKDLSAGEELRKNLQKEGFDGVIAETGDGSAYAVFEPTQIKSAIGMGGRYDITDPDITKAEGGEVVPEVLGGGTGLRLAHGGEIGMGRGGQAQKHRQIKEREQQDKEREDWERIIRQTEDEARSGALFNKRYEGQTAPLPSDLAVPSNKAVQDERLVSLLQNLPQPINPILQILRNRIQQAGPLPPDIETLFGLEYEPEPDFASKFKKGGEVHMDAGGDPGMQAFFQSYGPPAEQPSDEILVGRGVRRKRPQIGEIFETPAYAVKSALGAMGSTGKGAIQATAGLLGDVESLVYGTGAAISPQPGEGRLDAFLRGMEGETYFPTTEDIKAKIDPVLERYGVPEAMSQFETLGEFAGIPISVGAVKRGVGAVKEGAEKLGEAIPEMVTTPPVGSVSLGGKPEKLKAPADELKLYSQAQKAALNLQRKQGTGDSFLNDLTKAGVSKDELEYSGLNAFLRGNPKATKDEIQEFIESNRYKLREIEKKESAGDKADMEFDGGAMDDPDYVDSYATDIYNDFDSYMPGRRDEIRDRVYSNYTPDELNDEVIRADIDKDVEENIKREAYDYAYSSYWDDPTYKYENNLGYTVIGNDNSGWTVRDPNGKQVGDWFKNQESAEGAANSHAMDYGLVSEGQTQYHDYQLPMGYNYRELLIQYQPKSNPLLTRRETDRREELMDKFRKSIGPDKDRPEFTDQDKAELDKLNFKRKQSEIYDEYNDNPHWDEEDVIAHMRLQDRQLSDGKPMLYVDEMQSDWHQQGSDRGYRTKENMANADEIRKAYREKKDAFVAADSELNQYRNKRAVEISNQTGKLPTSSKLEAEISVEPEYKKLLDNFQKADAELKEADKPYEKLNQLLPDAPFKDTWHKLALKRALSYAAQNGYDRVGFSAASPQIKRWGTQEIAWEKTPGFENSLEGFKNYLSTLRPLDTPLTEQEIQKLFDEKTDSIVKNFEKETKPGWRVVGTEQRGGMAGRINLEAEARARGILKEKTPTHVTSQEDLRKIVDSTTRGLSEDQIDRITKKTWERMQKFDTGMTAPREEGMRAFYDNKLKKALEEYAKIMGGKFYESSTKVGRGVGEGQAGYVDVTEPVYVFEITPEAKESFLKGQSYKEGGLVEHEFAKGGRVGAIKTIVREAKEAGERIAKEEKAIAKKRMSREEAEKAGLWHPISETKLSKPIGEFKATIIKDPSATMTPKKAITVEEMQGGVAIPLAGDRAAAGRIIKEIEGVPMDVTLEGGPDFMRLHPGAAWASGKGVLSMLADRIRMARESGQPIYGVYTAMSPQAVDFNTMMTESLLNQLDISDLKKADIKDFNQAVKAVKGQGGKPKAPNFPGLDDPEIRQKLLEGPGGQRDAFVKAMSKAQFQKRGFPNVAAARLAVTEPELLDVPRGSSGYTVAQLDPEATIMEQSGHKTYPLDIMGEYVGGLETQLPVEMMYPTHFEAKRLLGSTPTGAHKSLELFAPLQYLDQQWLDNAMQFLEFQKKLQGRKKGGLAAVAM